MPSRLSIVTAFLLFTHIAYAQSSWHIDKLGVRQGLSEGNVYVIHQDKKGFIWIGTHGGLNRYDGYGFRVFQYTPFNASTLGDNAVFFLKEDSSTGRFWIGGSSCLNEFDPETFVNIRYRYAKKQVEFADGLFVNQHEILLACENEVLLFNLMDKQFSEIPVLGENAKTLSISRVENLATDNSGNLMIMSRTGIFFYDTVAKQCRRKTKGSPDFSSFNDTEVFNVTQDSHGQYWIATNKQGVMRFNPLSKQTDTIALPDPLKNEELRFDIIKEDAKGNIWAGSSNGLFKVDPASLRTEYFPADASHAASLSHAEVNVITEDRNHFLWIGTVGGGVNKMIPQASGFNNYNLSKPNGEKQTGSYIMAIQELGDNIWFTNIWDQIGKVNRTDGTATLLNKPLLPAGYSWYSEGTIIKSKPDELSILNGEQRYDITERTNGKIAVRSGTAPGLSHIFHDKNGRTWYFVKAAVERIYQRNDTIYGNCFFYDAKEDKANNLWIGSSIGLVKFGILRNEFIQYRHSDTDANSISSNFIYSLQLENGENVWMAAYNGGLCCFHIPSGKFRHFGKEDGLSDNIVYSVEKDLHGNLWFSSNAGISAYNIKTKSFRNYGISDGLLNTEFNRRSSYCDNKGWLFFGGVSGIDYFHPDSIAKTTTEGNLAFTGFRIFNKDYTPAVKNNAPLIELEYDDRYITIEFSFLSYDDQQKIQYAYRIDHIDWINTGNQRTISFSQLSTGVHHLYIRSTNSEGSWLKNSIHCQIIVHPAWWQTAWFRWAASALVLIFLAAAISLYYRRKLEKQKIILEKQQAVEKERTRIATDMHDDLGAGLSRIRFLSETIGIKKQKQQNADEEISSIKNYASEMIDKMGEIVWALNERNDSLVDLLTYIRAYAAAYLSQNNIQLSVHNDEKVPELFITGDFRRNVYLTVKEALHNIVKHAQASAVNIFISADKELFIRIHDNGKGFDEAHKRPFGNGLRNMRDRITGVGGTIEMKTAAGCTITLRVPLP